MTDGAKTKKPKLLLILAAAAVLALIIFGAVKYALPTRDKRNAVALADARVGSIITFGTYEQDNDTSNGKEDIEWLVLAKEEDRILVISRYALDCQPYNTRCQSTTWQNCTLRKWLNDIFLNTAFSEEEQARIPTVTVNADRNLFYSTNPGSGTRNQIFLLSIQEFIKYISSDEVGQCMPTEYAKAQGCYVDSDLGACLWWLRSPGCYSYYAAGVSHVGSFDAYGIDVNHEGLTVRPALWINLSS